MINTIGRDQTNYIDQRLYIPITPSSVALVFVIAIVLR